jgi:hypothetical protein
LQYRLGFLCHGLLLHGFKRLFGKSQKHTDLYSTMVQDLFQGSGPEPVAMTTPTENLHVKVLRVRAKKSWGWMTHDSTPTELVICVCVTQCLLHLAWKFFKEQCQQAWLCKNPDLRPVINLASQVYSPAILCLGNLTALLQAPAATAFPLLDGF